MAASVTDRHVLARQSRPNRRLSLLPIIVAVVVLVSALPLLPAVHGARALEDGKETKASEASNQMMQHAAATARWSVTVREGGHGAVGGGHAGGGHAGHGSGHGRVEPAGRGHPKRSAAAGRELGSSSMAAASCNLLFVVAAAALLRF
uniref:Uncharacterized protein n=1 Tax=Leersia perrieri TaxID=77586 RepID=A0A0D9WXC5_9ORYZ